MGWPSAFLVAGHRVIELVGDAFSKNVRKECDLPQTFHLLINGLGIRSTCVLVLNLEQKRYRSKLPYAAA